MKDMSGGEEIAKSEEYLKQLTAKNKVLRRSNAELNKKQREMKKENAEIWKKIVFSRKKLEAFDSQIEDRSQKVRILRKENDKLCWSSFGMIQNIPHLQQRIKELEQRREALREEIRMLLKEKEHAS